MRKITLYLIFSFLLTVCIATSASARLIDRSKNDNLMVIFVAKAGAEDYLEYAETVLKERLKNNGFRFMNKEVTDKIKKNRLLMEAIKNSSATAMANINATFGASILIKGTLLSVKSAEKVAGSWEGNAALSMVAIDTKTGEEIEAFSSDPMGISGNPAPIEESSTTSKQMAIKSALDNVMQKLGAGSDILTSQVTMTLKLLTSFKHTVSDVYALQFSKDNQTLFIGGKEGVEVWKYNTPSTQILTHSISGKVTSMALNSDSSILAVGTSKGRIHFYSPSTAKILSEIKDAHSSGVWSLDFSSDGKTIVSGGGDGYVRLWHTPTMTKLGDIRAHNDKVTNVVYDISAKNILTTSEDMHIKVWDLATRKEVRAFSETMDRMTTSTFSADRSTVAYAAKTVDFDLSKGKRIDKRFIRVRDCNTGRDLATFEGHSQDITSLSFLSGRRFLASAGEDRLAKVWDIEKRTEIAALDLKSKETIIAVTKNDRLLATADSEEIMVWSTR